MKPYLLFIAIYSSLLVHSSYPVRGSTAAEQDGTITGRLLFPGSNNNHNVPPGVSVWLYTGGKELRKKSYPNPDGSFVFEDVEYGVHSLDVDAVGYLFPTITIVKEKGRPIKATAADVNGNPEVEYPLRLPPMRGMQYYEVRQGFNIMSWLKTPYGIMLAFAVGSMVLLPMLKVDPEEYRAMMKAQQEQSQGSGGDSKEKKKHS